MDHLVLIRLDVFEDIFTFEVLDCEEGRVEWDSDLVEDCNQRLRPSEAREKRGRCEGTEGEDREDRERRIVKPWAGSRVAEVDGEWDWVK
jgi:hypothetical protein